MNLRRTRPWPLRLVTFALWALAAASVVAWALRLNAASTAPTAAAAPAALPAPDADATARLLGAAPAGAGAAAAPAEASRYALIGVLSQHGGARGAALIAVGGEPARPFRVGAPVDGDLVLLALGRHAAQLGPAGGAATVTLELPAPH